jgi:hypothetical protein
MLFIFDLDGTVIDSSHRQNTLPDGTLNLADWIENNTPEKIARDTLLPLADEWRTIDPAKHDIVVMTARVLQDADYNFLQTNGLFFDKIYSRNLGDTSPDGELKTRMIFECARDLGRSLAWMRSNAYMFDDSNEVRKALHSLNIKCYNPNSINARSV